jgi:RecB family exonuclease
VSSPILLRTSERSAFKRCRQHWWWAYEDHLKPKVEKPALRFGTLIHKALETRYPKGIKRGPHPAIAFAQLYEEQLKELDKFGFKDEDGVWTEAAGMGEAMLNGYIDKYGDDDEFEVLATEQTFGVPVYNAAGRLMFSYVGTLDGIWRSRANKRIVINDYKTATSISTAHLPLDEQAGAYWRFGVEWMVLNGILQPNQQPERIMFNFLRKAMPDQRPTNAAGNYLNQDGTISKKQPPPYFHREYVYRDAADLRNVALRAYQEAREHALVRSGKLAVYKNPGPFTCMGCGFKDMCELHEAGADWESYRDMTMTEWDPYDAHEIENERE